MLPFGSGTHQFYPHPLDKSVRFEAIRPSNADGVQYKSYLVAIGGMKLYTGGSMKGYSIYTYISQQQF